MSRSFTPITPRLHEYLLSVSLREHEQLQLLRKATARLPMANMQISPEQGQLMQLLCGLLGARRTIEVGVFTGYSALAVALALPKDGHLLACDISTEWTSIGRGYWTAAGVADRIELVLAPAEETLRLRVAGGAAGSYDFAFIDADKGGYETYFELCLQLLRPGGLVAVDNTLWDGRVADDNPTDPDTRAIRAFNTKLHADPRVELSLVPIGDGLTLARKLQPSKA